MTIAQGVMFEVSATKHQVNQVPHISNAYGLWNTMLVIGNTTRFQDDVDEMHHSYLMSANSFLKLPARFTPLVMSF